MEFQKHRSVYSGLEGERIAAGLNVATRIQAGMLPCIFPADLHREEFDLYACAPSGRWGATSTPFPGGREQAGHSRRRRIRQGDSGGAVYGHRQDHSIPIATSRARMGRGNCFQKEWLLDTLREMKPDCGVGEMVKEVVDAALQFGGGSQVDDITLGNTIRRSRRKEGGIYG